MGVFVHFASSHCFVAGPYHWEIATFGQADDLNLRDLLYPAEIVEQWEFEVSGGVEDLSLWVYLHPAEVEDHKTGPRLNEDLWLLHGHTF